VETYDVGDEINELWRRSQKANRTSRGFRLFSLLECGSKEGAQALSPSDLTFAIDVESGAVAIST
jgi:hypothetical protein